MAARRVLYLEPTGGIAGDMFLAAALDAGVPRAELEAQLHSLAVPGWRLVVTRQERHAITGTHVQVVLDAPEDHPHRSYKDIAALIHASALPERAKAGALHVFRLIGEVEARIHGTTLDLIHFHEVGAVDSIVDICGAAVALELLGAPDVFTAPPPLGSGTARIAHGVVPVPVPATLELLKDVPVRFEGVGELTTPTGAALLKAFATFAPPPELTVERIGYGLGTKDFKDRANVLRLSVGQTREVSSALCVLECNLDDCSPQVVSHAMERLFDGGALDVWVTPVLMKKGRPGFVLSVLAGREQAAELTRRVLAETTTLGVRETAVGRHALERRFERVETAYGPVQVKIGALGAQVLNAAPEFEEAKAAALKHGVPVKEVLAAALAAWRAKA